VNVEFLDNTGAQVGSGLGAANDVDAGQTAKTQAVDITTGNATRCKITDVERYAS
jgi:hypothetical protein